LSCPESPEGVAALSAGAAEAELVGTDLIIVNLSLTPLDTSSVPPTLTFKVIDRKGKDDRDPVDAVLDEIRDHDVSRLVVGMKRRTPVGEPGNRFRLSRLRHVKTA
jgi:hypothetical protein